MNPSSPAQTTAQPLVNDVTGPTPPPPPKLVDNIPIHTPGQTTVPPDEDAELDKIMQDVGREMQKDDVLKSKHHFWNLGPPTAKKVKNVSASAPGSAPKPSGPHPPQSSKNLSPRPSRSTAVVQKAVVARTSPKSQDNPTLIQPKHHFPLAVTALTILVTAALITAAYYTYK